MRRCQYLASSFFCFVLTLSAYPQSKHTQSGWPPDEEFLKVNQVIEAACQHSPGVDEQLVWALIWEESKYDPLALGSKGEVGLGQLMPQTALTLGVQDRTNVQESVDAVVRHLSYLLKKYHGNVQLTLAAYNAGEPAVDGCRCVPQASRGYVNRIEQNQVFAHRIVEYVRTAIIPSAAHQGQIHDLQAKIAALQQRREQPNLDHVANSSSEGLASAQAALESANAELQKLVTERDALRSKLQAENGLTAQAFAMFESLRQRIDQVEEKLAAPDRTQEKKEDASAELNSVRIELAELKNAMQNDNQHNSEMEKQIEELSAAISRLSNMQPAVDHPGASSPHRAISKQSMIALVVASRTNGTLEAAPDLTGALQETFSTAGMKVDLELQAPGIRARDLVSLVDGDGRLLQRIKSKHGPNWDWVFVLEIFQERVSREQTDTLSSTITARCRIFTPHGELVALKTFSSIGAGFTALDARQMALTRLSQVATGFLSEITTQ